MGDVFWTLWSVNIFHVWSIGKMLAFPFEMINGVGINFHIQNFKHFFKFSKIKSYCFFDVSKRYVHRC